MPKATVLIVEDEEKIASVVKAYMEKADYQVFTALDGSEALNAFEAHHPDAVVLDLMLPKLSGEEVLQAIRRQSSVPVLLLTAKGSESDVVEGLALGADGYVIKPFRPRELVARLDALVRRFSPKEEREVVSFNDGELNWEKTSRRVWRGGREVTLTPNEYKLFQALSAYPGKVFTREELILCAFGFSYEGYERTVDSHIKNLRAKLEDSTESPQYILTVRGVGYRFGGVAD